MTTTGGPVTGHLDLFGEAVPDAVPEPVLMALHAEYYDLIWQGAKTHEFRRWFLEGRPVRWFVCLNAPVPRRPLWQDPRFSGQEGTELDSGRTVEETDLPTPGGHSG